MMIQRALTCDKYDPVNEDPRRKWKLYIGKRLRIGDGVWPGQLGYYPGFFGTDKHEVV